MSFGIVEVISLLLGMSGFGVQQHPKAPTADVALQYAMADADVVVHVDAGALVPGNYKVLQGLPNQAGIKASPELAQAVRKMINEVEGVRGLAKGATGIDLVNDINDATMFFQIVPRQNPTFVAVVHGKFAPANIDKIAKMSRGQVSKIGGGVIVEMQGGGDEPAIAVTKDGVMLAGTPKLVRDRLADTWKAPARPASSNLAYAAEVLGQKPIFSLVLTMSKDARTEAVTKIGGKNFLTDVIQRHKLASFSVFHNGVGWSWIDSNKTGLDSMALVSEGAIELFRAGHIAPRGIAKMVLGAMDSYRGTDKQVDELIRRKADVIKVVESYTGDGKFDAKVDKDPKTLRLTVRATGKSLSDVVPAGLFLPGAAAGFLLVGKSAEPPPPMSAPPPQQRATSPGLGGPKKK